MTLLYITNNNTRAGNSHCISVGLFVEWATVNVMAAVSNSWTMFTLCYVVMLSAENLHQDYFHGRMQNEVSSKAKECLKSTSWSLLKAQYRAGTEEISFPGCQFSLCTSGHISVGLAVVLIQLFGISESARRDVVKKTKWDFNIFSFPSGCPSSLQSSDIDSE